MVDGFTTGSSGCGAFHNSLLIFCRAMSPTTPAAHGAMTWFCWRLLMLPLSRVLFMMHRRRTRSAELF
ncbi:hypothetical protein B7R77_20435 [Ralstonia solanacearum K60]|uniref:Uncharacterized protein n=1 Tax=Ralstonia solanacearum K60 TaxID=1091042 RepID=A0AAP8D1R4_RALSL|nr:hypothetical protein B7R77_20435 [Ralstonia solanacearum K60]